MSYPHYGTVQPALDTLVQLGTMLPTRHVIRLTVYADGSVATGIDSPSDWHTIDDLAPDNPTCPTPDLIRLVQHVRRLEGLE